ncbi:MAG: hypothetical protein JWN14_793 [Chthonomonadales bacterium]|nr:hypothetical protein [Chthonomonadales bacterium]
MADNTQAHNALCRQVAEYIAWNGGYLVKNWGGPIGAKGRPDFEGCMAGKFVAIEVKTGTGELSKDQRDHMRRIVEAGGIFIEARTLEFVEDTLFEHGLVAKRLL